jgi:hypothetical protein
MNEQEFLKALVDLKHSLEEEYKKQTECKCKKQECKKPEPKPELKKEYPKLDYEFENECQMVLLQVKSFVLDALMDKNKKYSQTLINFLDSLNAISIIA